MSKSYKPGWRSPSSRGKNQKKKNLLIAKLKISLPVAIFATLALVFIWPKLVNTFKKDQSQPIMERILKVNPQLENKVIGPKFESLDRKGRPFLVEADYALRLTPEKTELIHPKGHMTLEDGSTLSFRSKTGFYYKEEEILDLAEDVNFTTDKGYDMKTRTMRLFPKQNCGEGNEPVHGTGPSGESIHAEAFKIKDKGDKIDFLGKTLISLPGS